MAAYQTVSHGCARELILSHRVNSRGKFFRVAFDRVTTSDDERRRAGDLEVLMARFNVRRHLRSLLSIWLRPDGTKGHWVEGARPLGAAYDRHEAGCFCIFVVGRHNHAARGGENGYRSIRFDSVRWLKLNGTVYKVGESPPPQH